MRSSVAKRLKRDFHEWARKRNIKLTPEMLKKAKGKYLKTPKSERHLFWI